MERVRRICCAIDLTSRSAGVVRDAAGLARALEAELLLVHAGGRAQDPAALFAQPEVQEETRHQLALELEEHRRAAEDLRGAKVRAALLPGRPAVDQIVAFARREGCDLIVVGAHHGGHSLFEPLPEKLVRHAHCSVLTLRPQ